MPQYSDVSGDLVSRPAEIPARWNVSCYAIIVRDGQLLVVQSVWSREWQLPGGSVEITIEETLLEAVRRECLEETGYRVNRDGGSLSFEQEGFYSYAALQSYSHTLQFTVLGTIVDEPHVDWSPDEREIGRVAWIDPVREQAQIQPVSRQFLIKRGMI